MDDKSLKQLFKELKKLYQSKPKFFRRPLLSNTPYKYKKAWISSPNDFYLKIQDEFADEDDDKLKSLMTVHSNGWNHSRLLCAFMKNRMYVGMPVICALGKLLNPVKFSTLQRGEVKKFHKNKKKVDITLVDIGLTVTIRWYNIFPVTVEILRIPITLVPCCLSFIEPSNGSWPDDVEIPCRNPLHIAGYVSHFTGESQVVYFNKQCRDTKRFEVTVEVNHVNLALKYLHQVFRVKDLGAKPIELPLIDARVNDTDPPRFPINDFTPWIGFKFMVFGVNVFQDDDRVKCRLQVLPDMVNSIMAEIEELTKNADEMIALPPFKIVPGVCCLARDEYLSFSRVRILRIMSDKKVFVDYVDHKETGERMMSDLYNIPDQLLQYPEGAKVCIISDFLDEPCKNMGLLTTLIREIDLYAVIDDCDADNPEADLKVSLFHITEAFSGKDISFINIFNVSRAPVRPKRLVEEIDVANEAHAEYFLGKRQCDPNVFRREAKFTIRRNGDLISFRSEDENEVKKLTRIAAELNECYENFAESPSRQTMGKHVVVKQIEDDNNRWYRAKVMEEKMCRVKLLLLDLEKVVWVKKTSVFPLFSYVLKDPILPFQLKLMERNVPTD